MYIVHIYTLIYVRITPWWHMPTYDNDMRNISPPPPHSCHAPFSCHEGLWEMVKKQKNNNNQI